MKEVRAYFCSFLAFNCMLFMKSYSLSVLAIKPGDYLHQTFTPEGANYVYGK